MNVEARDRILDAAEALICSRGNAGFTLDAVAQAAGVSKGGLLYHFRSKDCLIQGMQQRLASRIADVVQGAASRSETPLHVFVRHLRREYKRGGRSFAPLLLAREREEPCKALDSVMACLARTGAAPDRCGSVPVIMAALGLVLSSLARIRYDPPGQAAELWNDLEATAGTIGADPGAAHRPEGVPACDDRAAR